MANMILEYLHLHNVISKEDCMQYIRRAEQIGFEAADTVSKSKYLFFLILFCLSSSPLNVLSLSVLKILSLFL